MSAAAVLTQAISFISKPETWAREGVAFDAHGNEVKPTSERAKRFCMVGAIQKVSCSAEDYGSAIRLVRAQCGKQSIFEFNDGHGHKAVLKCMRRAVAAAEVSA
jgi:hypothetical protein